jgi:hypothetical protein
MLSGNWHYRAAKGLKRILSIKEACIIRRDCHGELLGAAGTLYLLILGKSKDPAQLFNIPDPVMQLPSPIVPVGEGCPREKLSAEYEGTGTASESRNIRALSDWVFRVTNALLCRTSDGFEFAFPEPPISTRGVKVLRAMHFL